MDLGIILSLTGGLGLFLYGMKLMSDGLEKAAGAKLRGILEFFTKNRFVGMLVGLVFCAIVQSSSATTVMVVSFVNSGLMTLYQAAGVIMGANIGTTVTSQLVSLNLSEIAPIFLMAGVIMVMFCKKTMVKKVGEVFLGFGILFMGLNIMSGSMASLRESPQIVEILSSLTNPFLGLLTGFVITAIIQSSSVTVSIVLLMAQQGLLALPICFYIILGCNIGSCISALLASLGGRKEAKRAAMIHFLFNVIGSMVIVLVLTFAIDSVAAGIGAISHGDPGRSVANAHTIFKVFQVVILFPFSNWLVKLTCLLIPGKEQGSGETFDLEFIGAKNVFSPTTAVMDVTRELERMGKMAIANLNRAMDALLSLDEKEIDEVCEVEKHINFLNHAITDYLVKISQSTLPVDDANSIGGLFHVVNDIERIGDHAENVAEAARQRIEKNINFSGEVREELHEIMGLVNQILEYSLDTFSHNSQEHVQEIQDIENRIDAMEKELQQAHINRLTQNECTPAAGMIYSDLISGLERVADHATNIAFAIYEAE